MNASSRPGAGEPLPRLVFWEVTQGCNLRCVHCRSTATELASPSDLPTAQCLNIVDQIAALSDPILVLSGGEPLYRPDIFQLAQYATSKGLRVALATNGTLITKDVALQIVESGIERVSISLDGSNADTHDGFRGIPGSFDAAIYGFRNLKALGIAVQIDMTIARHNAEELPKVLELVRNLGADALHIFPLDSAGCGVEFAEAQRIAPDEYERIPNWFYDQAAEGDFELKAGTGVCFISFEGEVSPCGCLHAVAGDLRTQSFADIWNHAAVFAGLRDASQLEGKCGCREFRNLCMGCRARAYAANGTEAMANKE